jgi:hypothetical protein
MVAMRRRRGVAVGVAHDAGVHGQRSSTRSDLVLTALLLAIVVIGYALAITIAGYPLAVLPLVAGALGWLIALAARTPVILVAMRLFGSSERALPLIIASSGPTEETVRVIAVLLVGRDLATALWLGFGWTAIEIGYTYLNSIVVAQLLSRGDPQAQRVLELVPPAAVADAAPWWSAIERAGVSALHIGFTLIVAVVPIAFVLTALIHSAFNLITTALNKRWPIVAVEGLVCLTGAATLLVGLAMMGVL